MSKLTLLAEAVWATISAAAKSTGMSALAIPQKGPPPGQARSQTFNLALPSDAGLHSQQFLVYK